MPRTKVIYRFDEGSASLRDLLGGKGANLGEMTRLGLPVPPGFIITTEVCRRYYALGRRLPRGMWPAVVGHVRWLERTTGRGLGSPHNPLLLSVRSGAKFSMPGMMDTILNLGIYDQVTEGLARLTGDRRFALDAYRRFLQLFGSVVLGVPRDELGEVVARRKERAGVALDHELSPDDLEAVIAELGRVVRRHSQRRVPRSPWQQLRLAVEAVFASWNNPRAIEYRNYHRIPHELGTAVTVQAMVMGNLDMESGAGVLFTRNPATGDRGLFGEYLPNAQGEDVVAGTRTPMPISWLAENQPDVYRELEKATARLEQHYRDVQDVEFTVERGRLYILQTRSAQRTAIAAVRTAVAMASEGLITREEALLRVSPQQVSSLLVPQFDSEAKKEAAGAGRLLARCLGASPGAAVGRVVFDVRRAVAAGEGGEPVILVRPETSVEDVPGVMRAQGVLTGRGGMTSHAAVVARGLGKPCVLACGEMQVEPELGQFSINGHVVREQEEVSIDGASGEIFYGRINTRFPSMEEQQEVRILLSWADEVRRLGVMANADTVEDARTALALGAEGIGLCRTEHMLLHGERLALVRQALLSAAAGEAGQQAYRHALDLLESYHVQDFLGIMQVMAGRPVVIRLLDAPLHEFLPSYEELVREVARLEAAGAAGPSLEQQREMLRLVMELREVNPMLGHRGCRLGMTHGEIYQMQVRAIVTAACGLARAGVEVRPEIMVPMVADVEELRRLRQQLCQVAEDIQRQEGIKLDIRFGTMIEVPRAAVTAGDLALCADFFSFGSNDLTQMTWAFSRDDAEGKFLRRYLEEGVLGANPFVTIDRDGVGRLIAMAVQEGRRARPGLELGLCGEHGGDAESIVFCHEVGLDYVSCSPYRVPVARVVAAQAALGAAESTA
ncbi:MAG: pyruvate, phosphate dikinase [Dehalococcoidia bacterium]